MKNRKHALAPYILTFPSLFLTLALSIYPIGWAMRYMFYSYPGYGKMTFIGFDNFRRLASDEMYWHSVLNTLVYAAGKIVLTLPIALILAVILNQRLRGRHLLRAIYFLPTVISTAVMSVVFYVIFNSYNGILNQYLVKYGIVHANVDWLGTKFAMLTMIIIAVWGAIGNYMLLFLAGLQNIPKDVYESAAIDGANGWKKFFYVTVPMLGPVLQMIVLLAITAALKGYESIMVLTEGGPIGKTEVMYLYVYKLFFPISSAGGAVQQQIGYGSAVGFVSALIVGIVTLGYFYLSRRLNNLQD
ncbi:carbohydrate ABC transporter permease [Paenibacillus roseipurpureus]|uniref:Sugar ABC transporter permease n=1 Tax=Paenibacillus roseopurpureus TaxID=2918901 RepID=A0AA96LQA1_9BACL|nr:sugar ABC transporter permease [Paenibacillus sp. MBLB1832]WNR45342.1 sugar ABC transporter permease [Paenibacillus sp. MBLB1832]